jgi:hypothetical protein
LKKNVKLTRQEEMTKEIEIVTAECVRLRGKLIEAEENVKDLRAEKARKVKRRKRIRSPGKT